MPTTLAARPDYGYGPAGTAVPGDDGAWAQITNRLPEVLHSTWLSWALAGLLALLLALSLRSRSKRTRAEKEGKRADLTTTDRAVTRITGILATAVVATGAWKVFGDVLHLHPAIRLVLFFFAEAQIIAAWRRVRRHIHRHAVLGPGTRTIYGIALGSALVAAFDADTPVEVLLRFFAATVAAYMIAEELVEELDIHLTSNPHLRTGDKPRSKGRIKWAVNLERALVWLRLAEPAERTVEEVERQRRIARMARTAHRLHQLEAAKAAKWRKGWARRSLRRQTESANEHLSIATDPAALLAVRTQLALLYEVEDRTTRAAVADVSPLAQTTQPGSQPDAVSARRTFAAKTGRRSHRDARAVRTVFRSGFAPTFPPASLNGSHVSSQLSVVAAKPAAVQREKRPAKQAEKAAERPDAKPAAGANRPTHPFADDPNLSIRALARAYAKNPAKTNAELAKQAKVSEGTANRYLPKIRAAAVDSANADADEERAQGPLNGAPTLVPLGLPIPEPKPLVGAAVNGTHPAFSGEGS